MALAHTAMDAQDGPHGEAAADPWAALAEARTGEALCQAWLGVLCLALLRPRAGLLLLNQADGSFAPVAAVPPERDLSYLSEIAT